MATHKKKLQHDLAVEDQYSEFSLLHQLLIEPITCNHFGCGKKLTLQERLFGKTCVNHRQPVSQYELAYHYLARRKKKRNNKK